MKTWQNVLVGRLGWWAAVSTVAGTAAALVLGITTPPRSGPYCRNSCITYPYTDAAAFVPRDYWWMYPALLSTVALVVLVYCVHDMLPGASRVLSGAGVCLVVIGAGSLAVDYGLQLAVMQPALRAGQTEGLSLLSQYNPHGAFIGLEDLGYATVNLALLLLGCALVRSRLRLLRLAGWGFVGGGTATLLALVVLTAAYGMDLQYRFEVVALLITWLTLIAVGIPLIIAFARTRRA